MLGLGAAGYDDDDDNDDTLDRTRWLRTILGSPVCTSQAVSLAISGREANGLLLSRIIVIGIKNSETCNAYPCLSTVNLQV